MKRKIIKQGMGGNTIFLPKAWVQEQNLKPGDEVDVVEKDNILIISGKGEEAIRRKEIALEQTESLAHIRSVVASAYKAGYTEIVLNCKKMPSLEKINDIINSFTGLEITAQTKEAITIKSFLTAENADIENLIIKMFQIINVLFERIIEEETLDLKSISTIVRTNVRKLRDHCLRSIHLNNYGGDLSYDYYDLVTQLEKIAVGLYYMAEYRAGNKHMQTLFTKKAKAFFEECYTAYLKKEFVFATVCALKEREESEKTFNPKTLAKTGLKNPEILYYYEIMMRLRQLNSRIISLSS